MSATDTDDADSGVVFIREDDPAEPLSTAPQDNPPWRILIVDDDVDVHVVTKFALSNTHFQGRRLSFKHAYSAAEAMTILRDTPDIAMVLLDVIMETPEAGLTVARDVRTELHNELVRIVLRTGQPGQLLEHSIVMDYDISDFWCKADLTTRKLFTTVISSLRAYAALAAAAAERDTLEAALAQARQLQQLVDRHAMVVTLDRHGRVVEANALACRFAGLERAQLINRDLYAFHPAPFPVELASAVADRLQREGHWAGELAITSASGEAMVLRCAALAFKDAAGLPYRYVAAATPVDPP